MQCDICRHVGRHEKLKHHRKMHFILTVEVLLDEYAMGIRSHGGNFGEFPHSPGLCGPNVTQTLEKEKHRSLVVPMMLCVGVSPCQCYE